MVDEKMVRGFYKSRFIDSLEKDFDRWEFRYCEASNGESWIEWYGPEYINDNGERIKFFSGLNYTGAYINGRVGYTIGIFEWIFGSNSRRLRKAFRRMSGHVRAKRSKNDAEKMMKAL